MQFERCDIYGCQSTRAHQQKNFLLECLQEILKLSDAILDLLDNCLDGVVRQKKGIDKTTTSDYYVGFFSHISISKDSFIIEDNCGGIPKDVAEKYAFRMADLLQKRQKTCLRSVFMASE